MDDLYTVIEILKKFYAVNTLEELVLAQDSHISRLQEKTIPLTKANNVR